RYVDSAKFRPQAFASPAALFCRLSKRAAPTSARSPRRHLSYHRIVHLLLDVLEPTNVRYREVCTKLHARQPTRLARSRSVSGNRIRPAYLSSGRCTFRVADHSDIANSTSEDLVVRRQSRRVRGARDLTSTIGDLAGTVRAPRAGCRQANPPAVVRP